ncbi:hypothetical protein C0991_002321 [Blastosporella zonata]|nr:hypothetical protein C0991_002321 [Blastosporella zonata]
MRAQAVIFTTRPYAPGAKKYPWTTIYLVIWIVTLLLTSFLSEHLGRTNERLSESTERTLIRKQWDVESKAHATELAQWYSDRTARLAQQSHEIEHFKAEETKLLAKQREMIADYDKQERALMAKKQDMILEYTQEESRWVDKFERYKSQEVDLLRRQDEMEDTYRGKERAWRAKVGRFKDEWQRMVDAEVRERERARLYWDDIHGDQHCISNGRKKYSARLANLTPSLDGMEACKGGPRGIRGHWIADNEGVCAAYWDLVKLKVRSSVPESAVPPPHDHLHSKDCTAPHSGYRPQYPFEFMQRIETKLGTVHAGEDPESLCLSTPLSINGQMFGRPIACPDWVRLAILIVRTLTIGLSQGIHGVWGIWDVPDDRCN